MLSVKSLLETVNDAPFSLSSTALAEPDPPEDELQAASVRALAEATAAEMSMRSFTDSPWLAGRSC
jgi:hypothetical protein